MHIVRVRMPQMGSSVHESTVVEWKKGVGEAVVRGEVLITAESDKVDFEIEAPANGVLQEIKVNAEETISVGEVLGLIETEEEVAEEAEEEVEAAASPPSSNDDSPPEKAGGEDWVAPVAPMPRRKRPAPAPKAAAPPEPPPRPMAEGAHSQILSPRVQRLAAEYGLGMDQVSRILGTGAGGRITAKDVKQFVASGGAASAAAPASLTGIGEGAADGPPVQLHFRPLSEAEPEGVRERKEPFNRIRKRIAENLSRSAREIPQVTAHTEVDMTRVTAWREANKEAFEGAHGVRLTFTPFLALGIIAAVREREHARFNAALEKDVLTVKRYVNLGIAVDTPEGLVVPVLHGADGRGPPGEQ